MNTRCFSNDFLFCSAHPFASAQWTAAGRELVTSHVSGNVVYFSYGDTLNNTGPISIIPFNTDTLAFGTTEYAADTEALTVFRQLPDGCLYAPHNDSKSGNSDFSFKNIETGLWSTVMPVRMAHNYDIVDFRGKPYLIGAGYDKNAIVYELSYSDRNFAVHSTSETYIYDFARFYFGCVFCDKLYVQAVDYYTGGAHPSSKVFDGSSWVTGPDLLLGFSPGLECGARANVFNDKMVYLQGYYGRRVIKSLLCFNGSGVSVSISSAPDYCIHEDELFAIEYSSGYRIMKTYDMEHWQTVSETLTAEVPTTICYSNGRIFLGTANSNVYRSVFSAPTASPSTPVGTVNEDSSITFTWVNKDENEMGVYINVLEIPSNEIKYRGYIGHSSSYVFTNTQMTKSYSARVRYESANNMSGPWTAYSEGVIVPEEPRIEVISPSSGIIWIIGETGEITWVSTGTVGNVNIDLSTDEGTNYSIVLAANTSNDGTESITVPNNASTACRVRVRAVTGSPSDASNANFTIQVTPTITVNIPNGGDNWIQGTQRTITWTSANMTGNVNIHLSTDGGRTYPITLASNTSNDSSEAITVPNNAGTACRVRVQSTTGSPSDASDGNFTIQAPVAQNPVIQVSAAVLSFGEIEVGMKKDMTFDIANSGQGTLTGTILSGSAWLAAAPGSFSLAAGANATITVTADNSVLKENAGSQAGKLTIQSNTVPSQILEITIGFEATCLLARPNPAKRGENITFFGDGLVPGATTIRVYTLNGGLIEELMPGPGAAGETCLLKKDLPAGIYIYTYESAKEKGIGKFTVLK